MNLSRERGWMHSTVIPLKPLDGHLIKRDFPIFSREINGHPLIYLDSAATAQKPFPVIEAMRRFYADEYATVHRAVYALAAEATERYHQVRRSIQRFIGARRPEEIIFTRGTTDAINLVARSFGDTLEPGSRILLPVTEHHSNFVPWQMLAKRRGIDLVLLPVDEEGCLLLPEIEKHLSTSKGKEGLLSLAHISNFTGACQPLSQIIPMAHAYGFKVLVDAAQSIPHMPLDVGMLNADFLAFSGHKAFGPTGVGVLYGKYELLDMMAPREGGGRYDRTR